MLLVLLLGVGLGTVGCTDDDDPIKCSVAEEDVAGIWYYCEDCDKSGLQPQSKVDLNEFGTLTFVLPEQECNPLDGTGALRTSTGSWSKNGCMLTFNVTSAPEPDDQACSVEEGVGTAEIVSLTPGDSMVLRAGGSDVVLRRTLTNLDCYCAD
jgi:hypothetical protein